MLDVKYHLVVKNLGTKDYRSVWDAMQTFTNDRNNATPDEIWLVQHHPVFTQGQAGKPEHIINPGDIPIVQSDRGGQVTYHGPGQLVAYFLINLRRKGVGVRELVSHLENLVIDTLNAFSISSAARPDAPGVYVDGKKICSLGLRVRKGCSFHGLALNVNMDLSPFLRINPCGYQGLEMIQLKDLGRSDTIDAVGAVLINKITDHLNYKQVDILEEVNHHE